MEASETLVKILESVMQSHTQIVDALVRLEQRQQEHNLALAQAIGENTRLLAKGIEDNSRVLAEMLKHIADTASRTEQMTARILTELSGKGASH